jgi:hypothetical protein
MREPGPAIGPLPLVVQTGHGLPWPRTALATGRTRKRLAVGRPLWPRRALGRRSDRATRCDGGRQSDRADGGSRALEIGRKHRFALTDPLAASRRPRARSHGASVSPVDDSVLVAGIAGGISLVALGAGRYDRWREAKQRREDLERAERHRREDREHAEQQRVEDQERSRPGFAVEWNWNAGRSGVWIGINVTTLPGRPSTSLIEIGFAVEGEVELENLSGEGPDPIHARGHGSFPIHREITPCEPGRRYPFIVQLHGLGPFIDPDTQLIPYVVDVEGTRHEGRPLAIFGGSWHECGHAVRAFCA